MENYKIKLTAISPIHIGTGEVYEPINYVIDKEDKKNYMYIFDEFEFYKALDEKLKAEFNQIANDSKDGLRRLQNFIFRQKELCKKISNRKIFILKKVADEYIEKIGKNEKSTKKINQLIIEKTYISPNINEAIIPGSSLKGAIRTAFGEYELKKDKTLENYNNEHKLKKIEDRLKKYFSDILVSDSDISLSSTFVADAFNYKRKKETEEKEDGIKIKYEAIMPGCKYDINLKVKDDKIQIKNLIKICNDHYMPIFQSQFDDETDEFAKKQLSPKFVEEYENFKLKDNQFLLRVGKHSGARAVTIDGIREIRIMHGKGNYESMSEETTVWHLYKRPFGWLLCEVIGEK